MVRGLWRAAAKPQRSQEEESEQILVWWEVIAVPIFFLLTLYMCGRDRNNQMAQSTVNHGGVYHGVGQSIPQYTMQ